MLDKNDLDLIQNLLDTQTTRMMEAMNTQKKEILQETAASTRVLIDTQTSRMMDAMTSRMMEAMEAQKKDILQETAASTRVLIESSIMPKFDLLVDGQQMLLETLAPKSRVQELEEEVDFLKSIIKLHSQQIAELKKAQ